MSGHEGSVGTTGSAQPELEENESSQGRRVHFATQPDLLGTDSEVALLSAKLSLNNHEQPQMQQQQRSLQSQQRDQQQQQQQAPAQQGQRLPPLQAGPTSSDLGGNSSSNSLDGGAAGEKGGGGGTEGSGGGGSGGGRLWGPADADAKLQALLYNSPFIDLKHPVTRYELAKMIIMFPVVVTKFLLLIPIVFNAWLVLRLLLLGHKRHHPMHPLRRALVERWVRGGARLLLYFAGFYKVRCKGWDNMRLAREQRSILVFNHDSYVDAAVMAAFFAPSGVAKSGVAAIPFIGRFAIALQFFFVERKGTQDKANRFVLQRDPITAIKERAADTRYPLVMMAPEATTKAQHCLLRFRRGAFAPGRPITPVLLTYHFRHFNPGWGICSTALHVYRLMAQLYNCLEVEVLPPVHPSPQEQRDPQLFAETVRRLMAARMHVPLVDQGVAQERELTAGGVHLNLWENEVIVPRQR